MPWNLRISKGFISFSSLHTFFTELNKHDVVMVNAPNVEALPLLILARIMGKKVVTLFHCDLNLGQNLIALCITAVVRLVVFLELILCNVIITYPDYLTNHPYSTLFAKKLKTSLPVVRSTDLSTHKNIFTKKKGVIYVGFVGRLAREKGVELLIDALRLLSSSHKLVLVLAGPKHVVGEEGYRKMITEKLTSYNVDYILLGEVDEHDMSTLYRSLDVLVLTSTNSTEAMGISQMEAMTHGTPVVAPNLPGVRFPLHQTHMGELFRPGDVRSLTSALEQVLDKREKYGEIKKQKIARELFDPKKVYAFYDKLVGSLGGQ